MFAEWIVAVLTFVIAVLTFLIWKVYERIAWLTGAMESHSDLMLRIEARRGIGGEAIEAVWWDPTIAKVPSNPEHGKPVELNRIYVYLPPRLRRYRKSLRTRVYELFRLPET